MRSHRSARRADAPASPLGPHDPAVETRVRRGGRQERAADARESRRRAQGRDAGDARRRRALLATECGHHRL